MNVLVDMTHPAHVHQFKNAIRLLRADGHEVLVTARNKDVTLSLLDSLGIKYTNVGRYKQSRLGKALEMLVIDYKLYKIAKHFNPDVLVGGAGNVYVAHVSKVLRKPSIIFTDSEHARIQNFLSFPFASTVCTPSCFRKDLGKKQVRYDGYHELAYLHPNYFKPKPSILAELGLSPQDRFIVVRFVSWGASHDMGQRGITHPKELVSRLEPYGRVLITSEKKLDGDLDKYRITVAPEKLHDLLYYATLYIGEGATTASECAVLGTPAIYVNTLRLGYLDEQESKYGLVYCYSDPHQNQDEILAKAVELLQQDDIKQQWRLKRDKLLADKIDVTRFMVDLVLSQMPD